MECWRASFGLWSCGYTDAVGSRPNLANYDRWIFDSRKKIRLWDTSLWPPGNPSEVTSRQTESCLGYNDSQMGFYVDEQHDLRHQGLQRGHFSCSLRCEQITKEISKHKHHCSFKHYKVSFELQQCILVHELYLNTLRFWKITVWVLNFLWTRYGPRCFIYTRPHSFNFLSDLKSKEWFLSPFQRGGVWGHQSVTQLWLKPVFWFRSLCSVKLKKPQGQHWRKSGLDVHKLIPFTCSSSG